MTYHYLEHRYLVRIEDKPGVDIHVCHRSVDEYKTKHTGVLFIVLRKNMIGSSGYGVAPDCDAVEFPMS